MLSFICILQLCSTSKLNNNKNLNNQNIMIQYNWRVGSLRKNRALLIHHLVVNNIAHIRGQQLNIFRKMGSRNMKNEDL